MSGSLACWTCARSVSHSSFFDIQFTTAILYSVWCSSGIHRRRPSSVSADTLSTYEIAIEAPFHLHLIPNADPRRIRPSPAVRRTCPPRRTDMSFHTLQRIHTHIQTSARPRSPRARWHRRHCSATVHPTRLARLRTRSTLIKRQPGRSWGTVDRGLRAGVGRGRCRVR